MKNLKIFLVLFFLLFANTIVNSQSVEPHMSFEKTAHDFGKIKEEGGNVVYKFIFTNTGSKPIKISGVSSSCGCTTPDWSREEIPAGGEGFVSASYNPLNRPGDFKKSITVKSNADNNPVTLYVNGTVAKKEPKVEDQFRHKIGDLNFNNRSLYFNQILKTESSGESPKGALSLLNYKTESLKNIKYLEFINLTDKDITVELSSQRKTPSYLNAELSTNKVAPKETGKIFVSYNTAELKDWGQANHRIYLKIDGQESSSYRINVTANITETFSEEQLENPPVMTFTNGTEYNFGKMKQGDKVEHIFKFKNTGKSDLIIRKTKTSCGCTAIAPTKKRIKPGEEAEIKAVFNSKGKRGKQNKIITITTNIPENKEMKLTSNVILSIKGDVETDK